MADFALPAAVRTLIDAGLALSRRSAGARFALARLDGVIPEALVPAPLAAEIDAAVKATTTPIEPREVEAALRRAWDGRPGDVLDEFDESPSEVRADAQLHHGVHDGEPVTIVVQRPGLAAIVRSDMSLLDLLGGPLGAVLPRADVGPLLREVRTRALDELDLENEASSQRRGARALRRVAGIAVAAPRTELSGDAVLVHARVDGPTLAQRAPADPGAVARALVKVFAGAPRAVGAVFADPRADEVVSTGDGIVLRRLGSARDVDPARLDAARDALAALRDAGGEDAFADAVRRLGLLGDADARVAHAVAREIAGDLIQGPARLDADALIAASRRAWERLDVLVGLAGRATPLPADIWPARTAGQLVALLARLGATEDWGALVLRALDDGWS